MSTLSKPKHIDDLHLENSMNLNHLIFCKQDLEILTKRLGELAAQNTGIEVTALIEQFQNRFIRQKEVNDELRHKVKENENALSRYARNHPVAINHVLFENNDALGDEVKRYIVLYDEMKKDFMQFLAKHF